MFNIFRKKTEPEEVKKEPFNAEEDLKKNPREFYSDGSPIDPGSLCLELRLALGEEEVKRRRLVYLLAHPNRIIPLSYEEVFDLGLQCTYDMYNESGEFLRLNGWRQEKNWWNAGHSGIGDCFVRGDDYFTCPEKTSMKCTLEQAMDIELAHQKIMELAKSQGVNNV
jgi:hypothetical protein